MELEVKMCEIVRCCSEVCLWGRVSGTAVSDMIERSQVFFDVWMRQLKYVFIVLLWY